MTKNRKLRIAIVTNNYTPYCGGVVSSINAFTGQFLSLGHEVLIVTLDFLGKGHNDPAHVVRIPSIARFQQGKNHLSVPWRMDANVLRVLRKFNPDVIHTQHPFLIGQSALKAARILAVPIVFTYHTMYERYSHYVPLYQPLVRNTITKTVLSFCKKVDRIIVPSSAIREYVLSNGVTTPVTVIPSPLRGQFLPATRTTLFENNLKDRFKLLLVSRFVKEKSVPFVLDVVAQLDPQKFSLTLVGYGQEEDNLRMYAYQTLRLSKDQVRFVIKPPQPELVMLYKNADLFLFPSTSDTQGLVLAEAMAASTPVVAVDGAGQRDIIKNGCNGFIVSSKKEMIEKINQIADDEDLHKNLKNGARTTATFYSPAILVDKLLKVYDSC